MKSRFDRNNLSKDEFGYNLFTRLRHEMGQDVDAACAAPAD